MTYHLRSTSVPPRPERVTRQARPTVTTAQGVTSVPDTQVVPTEPVNPSGGTDLNIITNSSETAPVDSTELIKLRLMVERLQYQQADILDYLKSQVNAAQPVTSTPPISPPKESPPAVTTLPTVTPNIPSILRASSDVSESYALLVRKESIPTFDGTISKFKEFSALLLHHLRTTGSLLKCTDSDFIHFTIYKLRGIALEWVRNLPEADCKSFDQFYKNLDGRFGKSTNAGLSARKVLALRQGPTALNDHVALFRRLVEEATWNIDSQECRDIFLNSLSEPIQTILAPQDIPKHFLDLTKYALNAEHKLQVAPKSNNGVTPTIPVQVDATTLNQKKTSSSGKKKLSKEEKERRKREGLCAYCESKEHAVDACPNRPQSKSK